MLDRCIQYLKEEVNGKRDFSLKNYDFIIHCGACMFNRAYMLSRQATADAANIPMTNYGLALAELTGTKTDL